MAGHVVRLLGSPALLAGSTRVSASVLNKEALVCAATGGIRAPAMVRRGRGRSRPKCMSVSKLVSQFGGSQIE